MAWVGCVGTVVRGVWHAVAVNVVVAQVADAVAVQICLVSVRDARAVVAGVAQAITVRVLLARVGCGRAVVDHVGDGVSVGVQSHIRDALRELRSVVVRVGGCRSDEGTCRGSVGEAHREAHVARTARGHHLRAEQHFALAVAGGIAGSVGEEFKAELRVGCAAESALDGGAAARGCSQHREILQVVSAGVAVACIIGRHAVLFEINPQPAVGEDGIGEKGIAGAGVADCHGTAVVKSDGVAGSCHSAPDRVVARAPNHHAKKVTHAGGPRDVGTDQVALHQVVVPARREGGNDDADAVARDDIACPGGSATDRVVGPVFDEHSFAAVAQGGGAGDIGADQVTLHLVSATVYDLNAACDIGRD